MSEILNYLKKHSYHILGIATTVVLSLLLYHFRGINKFFVEFGYTGVFAVSVLGSATVFFPVAYLPIVIAASLHLNPLAVVLLSSLGSATGELTGYLAGSSGKYFVENTAGFLKVRKWMEKYGLWTIFTLSVIPNFIFDLAGIIAGSTKIPVMKYFMVTWAGKSIRLLFLVYLAWLPMKLLL